MRLSPGHAELFRKVKRGGPFDKLRAGYSPSGALRLLRVRMTLGLVGVCTGFGAVDWEIVFFCLGLVLHPFDFIGVGCR